MLRVGVMIALLALDLMGGAAGADVTSELRTLKRGQPAPVAAFIDRTIGCNHFAGEDPYDAEHRAFIAKAMRDLRCDRLDQDEAKLRRRYAHTPTVLQVLDRARALID